MVASDRISVFDGKLPTPIPGKGKVLNQISEFWFKWIDAQNLGIKHHMITTDLDEMGIDFEQLMQTYKDPATGQMDDNFDNYDWLNGRAMLCKQLSPLPIEAIVRGHLVGSGWKEYQEKGTLCGKKLPEGFQLAGKLDGPRFTPSTKADSGHDENITINQMEKLIGELASHEVYNKSINLYKMAYEYAIGRGIIVADTKFEWAWAPQNEGSRDIYLIDEVLTPDSSRFWDKATFKEGIEPPSLDKDNVRRWAKSVGYNGEGKAPVVPQEIVEMTQKTYIDVFKRLTGKEPVL
jgi:phosphoribosylaminoimidazole-succinocarboxamide synthase